MLMKNIVRAKVEKKFEVNRIILDKDWKRALPNIEFFAKKVAKYTLLYTRKAPPSSSLSIVLAGDDFVRALNKSYRNENKYTNVLSFPASDDVVVNKTKEEITLGDVILSLKKIQTESVEQNKSFKNHFAHLMVHGILHLLGYVHANTKEAKKMEELEKLILKNMGINNPYVLNASS